MAGENKPRILTQCIYYLVLLKQGSRLYYNMPRATAPSLVTVRCHNCLHLIPTNRSQFKSPQNILTHEPLLLVMTCIKNIKSKYVTTNNLVIAQKTQY